jgi:hypothetical protein
MKVKDAGRAILIKELKPGDLFAYKMTGSKIALGLSLAKNDLGYAVAALTHPPGQQTIIPSLVSDQFLENDHTVFVFDDASMIVSRNCQPEIRWRRPRWRADEFHRWHFFAMHSWRSGVRRKH